MTIPKSSPGYFPGEQEMIAAHIRTNPPVRVTDYTPIEELMEKKRRKKAGVRGGQASSTASRFRRQAICADYDADPTPGICERLMEKHGVNRQTVLKHLGPNRTVR